MTHAPRSSLSRKHEKCGWQSAKQTPYDNDVHVRPLTNRLTTAANAQPCGPAPTTKPPSHPTGDDFETVDTHDQKGTKLAQPTPETFPERSNLPGSGTNDGDR